jgi:hypothetical protein
VAQGISNLAQGIINLAQGISNLAQGISNLAQQKIYIMKCGPWAGGAYSILE